MRTILALAALSSVALADHYFDSLERVHLRFNRDNHFKVMQLTDLHFGEPHSGHLDSETLHLIRSLIGKENPDFIAITGDIVSGQAWDHESKKFWETHYKLLANELTSLQTPWAIVPGYHDFESDINQHQMMDLEGKNKYSASLPNFFEHYGKEMHHQFTFGLGIEDATNPDETDARLWFFGTGRADCMGNGGMNCIRRDQIEWFKDKSDGISMDDKHRGNGLAFMHHSLQEHMHLVNHYPVHGQKRDMSGCQAINTGLFSEIKQKGTVQWITAGGDHSSDFWGTYAGVNLAFGRKTGMSSYGPKFVQRGARIFDIAVDQDSGEMTVETWIRQ